MNTPNNDLPPLKNIEKSGTYVLRLVRPKDEKMLERFKKNGLGYASCRLFFLDGDGNCMTKNYSSQYGKGLALLIGKMTNTFCQLPAESITVEHLIEYVSPAFGRKATFEIDVTPDKEWNGKMQFKYKLSKISSMSAITHPEKSKDIPESFSSDAGEQVPF